MRSMRIPAGVKVTGLFFHIYGRKLPPLIPLKYVGQPSVTPKKQYQLNQQKTTKGNENNQ